MIFHYDAPRMKKERRPLHVIRASQRVTQDRLMLKVGTLLPEGRTMSQARYSQIENGVGKPPDKDEKDAVAAALDLAVSEIAWPEFPKSVSA